MAAYGLVWRQFDVNVQVEVPHPTLCMSSLFPYLFCTIYSVFAICAGVNQIGVLLMQRQETAARVRVREIVGGCADAAPRVLLWKKKHKCGHRVVFRVELTHLQNLARVGVVRESSCGTRRALATTRVLGPRQRGSSGPAAEALGVKLVAARQHDPVCALVVADTADASVEKKHTADEHHALHNAPLVGVGQVDRILHHLLVQIFQTTRVQFLHDLLGSTCAGNISSMLFTVEVYLSIVFIFNLVYVVFCTIFSGRCDPAIEIVPLRVLAHLSNHTKIV